MNKTIPAFYFPTAITFVDDSDFVLKDLATVVRKLPYLFSFYNNPFTALDMFNSAPKFFISEINSIDQIHKLIYNSSRFETLSVVVLDYDMPGMNALQLCKKLTNYQVKKIILTGMADEIFAIDAFNQGMINHFIRKQDPEVVEKIKAYSKDNVDSFFRSITASFSFSSPLIEKNSALKDSLFVEFFYKLIKQNKVAEYYLLDSMGSFLFLNSEGVPSALYIYDDLVLSQQDIILEKMIQMDSSQSILTPQLMDDLKAKRKAIYFPHFNNANFPEPSTWNRHIHSIFPLEGECQRYYWAYAEDIPFIQKARIKSFNKIKKQER